MWKSFEKGAQLLMKGESLLVLCGEEVNVKVVEKRKTGPSWIVWMIKQK